MVAIGGAALVFHTQVRSLYQFIAVLVKRIRPEPIFKGLEHIAGIFRELSFGFRQIISQHPVIHRQLSFFAIEHLTKMTVLADVGLDVVIIDGIGHKPIIPGIAIAQFFYLSQAPIGNIL